MGNFGENLREAMKERELTQHRAGQLCGVTQKAIGYYCSLKKPPHANIIRNLTSSLKIPLQDLVGRGPGWVVRESPAEYPRADEQLIWMADVKLKWKRRSDHTNMELAIRSLFEDDARAVLRWLDED